MWSYGAAQAPSGSHGERRVKINATWLSAEQEAEFVMNGTPLQPGMYWYDPRCGLWGLMGGEAKGLVAWGRTDWGAMPPGCSGSGSTIYLNGRELHAADVAWFRSRGIDVRPGAYWIDGYGTWGYAYAPQTPVGNIAAQLRNFGRSGDGFYRSAATGATMNSDASGGYISFGDGSSYSW